MGFVDGSRSVVAPSPEEVVPTETWRDLFRDSIPSFPGTTFHPPARPPRSAQNPPCPGVGVGVRLTDLFKTASLKIVLQKGRRRRRPVQDLVMTGVGAK